MPLQLPDAFQPKAGDTATATAAAAVATYAAATNQRHQIWQIDYGYNATPVAPGTLKIEDVSGTVIYLLPVVDAGAHQLKFPAPIEGAAINTAMIVTLSSGGTAIVGYLNVLHTEAT